MFAVIHLEISRAIYYLYVHLVYKKVTGFLMLTATLIFTSSLLIQLLATHQWTSLSATLTASRTLAFVFLSPTICMGLS